MEHVTREVNQLPGIKDIAFILRTKTVTVTFDPRQVAADDVRRAIERADASMHGASDVPQSVTDLLKPNP